MPTPAFRFNSLLQQVFGRFALVLALTVVAVSLTSYVLYDRISEAAARGRLMDAEAHYSKRIASLDAEWSRRAVALTMTLGYFRLFDDFQASEADLTSYMTVRGPVATFARMAISDDDGVLRYAFGVPLTDSLGAHMAEGVSWHFADGVLYRVFVRHLQTASGHIHVHLYRPVDNAVLFNNADRESDLFLVWQGSVIASSVGMLMPEVERQALGAAANDTTDRGMASIPWGGDVDEAPRIVFRLKTASLFQIVDIVAAGGLFLVFLLTLSWFAIGRWLTRTADQVVRLSAATRQFAVEQTIDHATMAALRGPGVGDELASVAGALDEMMATVLEREADLRERGEEIRLLLESAGEGFYGVDLEGRCTFINRACLEMFGYESADDLLGRTLHGLTHHTRADGSAYPETECRIYQAFHTGVGVHVDDEVFWRRDGSSFPAEYSAFPILRDNRPVGSVISILNITQRRAAEENLQRQLVNQEIIASILALSLSGAAIDDILTQSLKLVLTSHNLDLLARGSIFLREGDRLRLVAQQGLHQHLLTECANIPLGYCLCGRAAETGAVVFAHEVDHRHDVRFPGMAPHGHYCMPIQSDGEVLGVLNLYVPENHSGSEHELRFVRIAADTLATVIRHSRVQEALQVSEERLRSLVDNASDSILVHDFDGRIVNVNRRACQSLGFTRQELGQMDLADIDADFDAATYARYWSTMTPGEPVVTESRYRHKDGHLFPVEVHLGYYETGKQPLVIVLAHDITERRRAEEQVRHLASHDALTGLPNRALFLDRLAMALTATRRSGNRLALLFVDLDGFKAVNDTMGHAAGDALLKMVASRLTTCVREMDTIARLGGDEFTILLVNVTDPQAAIRVAQKVLSVLGQPFPIDDREAHIGASIGIAQCPEDGESTETLLAAADRAMYEVKKAGKNNYVLASSTPRPVTAPREVSTVDA
ncbi:MAG: diguanylate cyclase [Alphaproteobacteria bacterium]